MITVKQALTPSFYTLDKSVTVKDAAIEMTKLKIGMVIIAENKQILGVFSERDIMVKIVAEGLNPETTPIEKVMTKKVMTVEMDQQLVEAWKIMQRGNFRHLPVIDQNGDPVGILSVKDILNLLSINHELDQIMGGLDFGQDDPNAA